MTLLVPSCGARDGDRRARGLCGRWGATGRSYGAFALSFAVIGSCGRTTTTSSAISADQSHVRDAQLPDVFTVLCRFHGVLATYLHRRSAHARVVCTARPRPRRHLLNLLWRYASRVAGCCGPSRTRTWWTRSRRVRSGRLPTWRRRCCIVSVWISLGIHGPWRRCFCAQQVTAVTGDGGQTFSATAADPVRQFVKLRIRCSRYVRIVGVIVASYVHPVTCVWSAWCRRVHTARFVAMGFNRIADRALDAKNPEPATGTAHRTADLSTGVEGA